MVMHAMTEERWQAGMREYLNANQYSNVDSETYFAHMNSALNTNQADAEWNLPGTFTETFDSWHKQMGHPIIYVNVDNGLTT